MNSQINRENIKEIPFSEPFINEEEIAEVVKVLQGKWITTGEEAAAFEALVREKLGVSCAVAVSSGTAALDISLAMHRIGAGDQVLTTAYTFASSVMSIIHRGAEPVFADVEPETFNIDPDSIEQAIDERYRSTPQGLVCKRSGGTLKGILPVHFGGQACEIDRINEIARKHNLFVVEDAAHSVGAQHRKRKIGKSSNFVCFSFYSNKNMTTAEGGMIVTDSAEKEKEIRMHALHGISKSNRERYHTGLPFYDVVCQGFKANLSDLHAALGVVQIKKLDRINRMRNEISGWYDQLLEDEERILTPVIRDYNYSARHLYPIRLEPPLASKRDEVILKLREKKIFPSVHFIPIHYHTYFKGVIKQPIHLPVTEKLFAGEISLPLFPGLVEKDIEYVVQALKEILDFV